MCLEARHRFRRSRPFPASLARVTTVSRRLLKTKMDSNSNSCDILLPKIEAETEQDFRTTRAYWTSENTMRLIEALEQYPELWNMKHPSYRNKAVKQIKLVVLAETFGTTVEEIGRKIHNLKTQFNNELRKIRKRQGDGAGLAGSGWEYFEPLLFLKTKNLNDSTPDPLGLDVNLEFTDSQAEEDDEIIQRAKALKDINQSVSESWRKKPMLKLAASTPVCENPIIWPEQLPAQSTPDEYQIFGDFVASELRIRRSSKSRNRMKRLILKAILQVSEEDDDNINP